MVMEMERQTGRQMPLQVTTLLQKPRRSDALPESTRYRDDGCSIHPHCLTCPLPRCRYEEPGGLRTLMNAQRDGRILALKRRGVPVEILAARFGVSRRTVFRIISALERRAGAQPAAAQRVA